MTIPFNQDQSSLKTTLSNRSDDRMTTAKT